MSSLHIPPSVHYITLEATSHACRVPAFLSRLRDLHRDRNPTTALHAATGIEADNNNTNMLFITLGGDLEAHVGSCFTAMLANQL